MLQALGGLSAGCLALDAFEHQAAGADLHGFPGLAWVFGLLGGALLALVCKPLLGRLLSRKDPYGEIP